MELSQKILSDITVFMKYAKYLPQKQRRETWTELVDRNKNMHLQKFPQLSAEIEEAYKMVYDKKILPSMRSLQFAGKPIEIGNQRIYNCCYLPIDHYKAFSETIFCLLSGCGVGYSVQFHHVEKLDPIIKPTKTHRFVVEDSIAGWADAIKVLMKSYFTGKFKPRFDFSEIRHKGAMLVTSGGKAPGPEPLKICLSHIEGILESKQTGEKLTTIECHDILCHLSDAVLAGGQRRSATLALFSIDDEDMLTCKFGNWWELNPQRARANNSALIVRNRIKETEFKQLWKKIELSNSGEPGISFSNDPEYGFNPCFSGDTLIETEFGKKPIKDVVGQINLVNYRGEIVDGSVWSSGVKETVNVNLSNGETLCCTPNHVFLTIDGTEIPASDLKGSRIVPFVKMRTHNDEFVKYGFLQGDGAIGRLSSNAHKGLEIFIGKNDLDIAELFGITYVAAKRSYYTTGFNDKLRELGLDTSPLTHRAFPTTFDSWSTDEQLSFLRGMYSANGSIIKNGRVSYKAVSESLILKLSSVLSSFGIDNYITTNKSKSVKFENGTYICRRSYDLNIAKFGAIKRFAELISFVHVYKVDSLRDILRKISPVVRSVRSASSVEVFDFKLNDDTHWGVVGSGFVAHNCHEISLRPFTFCNLVEINGADVMSETDFYERCHKAAFLSTLQASYTDFYYLRPIWKTNTEKDALIGVGITGIAANAIDSNWLSVGANIVKKVNETTSKLIGINRAARSTTVKPSGTSSCVLGTSSGIHAWHNDYYIRRIRVGKDESIYKYLNAQHNELVEDEYFRPTTISVISIPQKSPANSTIRTESAIELLERVKTYNLEWVHKGHNKGPNTNNVSATVSIKPEEWDQVGEWMWTNRDVYAGISVLPYDNGSYIQAPFTDCTKEEYDNLIQSLTEIDLTKVVELDDNTDLTGELACSSGNCEIK